jgi:nucleotide-binding universal stress UspA family protein
MPLPEESARKFTSPTSAAPVLIGTEGDGGRDAEALGQLLGSIRNTGCIVAHDLSSPGRMLIERAESSGAGTIVVGSPHHGRIGRALMGGVAEHLLDHAPCEVLVAPRGYADQVHTGLAKIAVAVDGTPQSKVALTRAEDLARQAGATIEILVASDPVVADIEATYPDGAPASMSVVLEAAIASVDPALAPTGKNVDPGWRQVVRAIAAAIAAACDPDVDLLVAGSRSPIEHMLLGSISKHLITEAPCPVLVVPDSKRV